MQSLRQVGSGLLFGLVCIAIVLGGFSLSMAEGGIGAASAPTAAPTLTPTLPIIVVPTLPALAVTEPVLPATETPVPTATVPNRFCLPPRRLFPLLQLHLPRPRRRLPARRLLVGFRLLFKRMIRSYRCLKPIVLMLIRLSRETVLSVTNWSPDRLFTFRRFPPQPEFRVARLQVG
jgi:hypothetical protein